MSGGESPAIRYLYVMNATRPAPGSQASLREANRERVLGVVRQHGPLTQVEIAAASGLSAATVSNMVRELDQAGMVGLSRSIRNGRRAVLVSLASGGGLLAGVAFGERDVRVAIASDSQRDPRPATDAAAGRPRRRRRDGTCRPAARRPRRDRRRRRRGHRRDRLRPARPGRLGQRRGRLRRGPARLARRQRRRGDGRPSPRPGRARQHRQPGRARRTPQRRPPRRPARLLHQVLVRRRRRASCSAARCSAARPVRRARSGTSRSTRTGRSAAAATAAASTRSSGPGHCSTPCSLARPAPPAGHRHPRAGR